MRFHAAQFRGFAVQERRIAVAGRDYVFIGPSEHEALLDSPRVGERFERDEYLPYWAEFWPASLLLIDAVASWGPPAAMAQVPTVLELGCGLGALSIILCAMGYHVIASDYDEDALAFTEENARLNGVPDLETRVIDWRQRYPDMRVDRMVASEVLYEQRNLEPVASFVVAHLDASGFALICDRNRTTADKFPDVARAAGLNVDVLSAERAAPPGELPIRGRIFRLLPHKL